MKISNHCCMLCFLCIVSLVPFNFAKAAEVTAPAVTTPSEAALAGEVNVQPVVVTATRAEKDLLDVPMSVGVVTAEEIKKNPATTVAELIKDIPGVELSQSSPGLIRVSIRGEGDRRTLILVDGQKVSEQKSMDGSAIMIDPSQIERVEVIKGPASVLYGSDAIGGVLNIITKKTTKDAIHGNVSITYTGKDNGLTESASLYGYSKGWSYQLSASNSMHNKTVTPYGYLPDTGYSQQNFSGMLSYDITPNFTVGAHASYFNFESTSGNVILENGKYVGKMDYYGSVIPVDFLVDLDTWSRTKVGVFAEAKDVSEYLAKARVDVYYQHTYKKFHNFIGFESTDAGLPFDIGYVNPVDNNSNNNLTTIGASLQTDWTVGDNHYFIFGYDFAHDTLNADDFDHSIVPASLFPGGPPMTTSEEYTRQYYDGTQTTHAFYLSGESTFFDKLTMHYGARYTGVITGMRVAHESVDGGPLQSAGGFVGSEVDQRVVFNAGLVWKPIDDLALRAHWGQGFRVPRLDERFLSNTMGGGTIISNPDLKPETSNNFEVGMRYNKNGFNADIAAFYSIADDYITTEEIADEIYKTVNIASAKTHGVEASISYTFDSGFKPYLSATYMARQYETSYYDTWDSGTPALTGRIGLAYSGSHFDDSINLNADVYVLGKSSSKRYYYNNVDPHLSYTESYDGFATLNAAFGIEFGPEKAWNLQAEVLNIFNTYYRDESNYPNPIETGTSFNVRLSYSF